MEQYSATCPHCQFVLQFYDASLFGRKGRCPKCRNKFVLNRSAFEPEQEPPPPIKPSRPAKKDVKPAGGKVDAKSAAKPPEPVATTSAVAAAPPQTKPSPPDNESAWEMDVSRGMGLHRPTLPARWVLPNVLSVTNMLVIAIGASTGMGAMSLLLKSSPVHYLAAASAAGGLVAAAFLVRRHKPQQ